ncbi:hypothetical protein F4782DRAFT_535808 [Xylaria castorea]|nr:hypothetical protein F4782DRAFT_535808 [Xylaria castorea]
MSAAELQAILNSPALPPPANVHPNFENPPNNNRLALGITIAALVVTTLAVLMRIHSWIYVMKHYTGRVEAFLVVAGYGSFLAYIILSFRVINTEIGFFVHQWDVLVKDTIPFSKTIYFGGLVYNSAILPVKAAILTEWMRIFSPRTRNGFWWTCQILLWFNVLYYTAATIVEARQCTPQAKVWDPTVQGGYCLDTKTVELTSSSINIVSDLVILLAPQHVIWRLQLSKAKKLGVALIFAVGVFGFISAIFRLVATHDYLVSKDATYAVSPVAFWAVAEMTSVFLVYGMPSIPSAMHAAKTKIGTYYIGLTKLSSRKPKEGTHPSTSAPWRGKATGPSSKYRNIDKDGFGLDTIDKFDGKGSQWDSSEFPRAHLPPMAVEVQHTVEVESHERQPVANGNMRRESSDEVLLRQHPWDKK